jgi:hypothetical protein
MRMLIWIPLATIIGLSLSLAMLLARPAAPTIVLTIVTPAAAPAPAPATLVYVTPYLGYWDNRPCYAWSQYCR